MTDETLMHLVIAITGGAFVAFLVHLMIGDDGNGRKKR